MFQKKMIKKMRSREKKKKIRKKSKKSLKLIYLANLHCWKIMTKNKSKLMNK